MSAFLFPFSTLLVNIFHAEPQKAITFVIQNTPSKCNKGCAIEMSSKHEKKAHYRCDKCPFITLKPSELKPHKEKEHDHGNKCDLCEFFTNDTNLMKKHSDDKHSCQVVTNQMEGKQA